VKAKKPSIDWEAVERDYRTDKFTMRELADKYGITNHQTIGNRAKRNNWTKDLGRKIKQATNAKLVQELVDKSVAKSGQDVANTVLAAAELNKQIILEHRKTIAETREAAFEAMAKVRGLGDSVADIREASVLAGAVESLTRSHKNLIELERKAFGIDKDDEDDGVPAVIVKDMTGRAN
jgi:hypothetical protein